MRILLGILTLALGAPAAAQTPDDPRTIVLAAERAVSDDSADVASARWRAALARDSSDRTALLGLATLARMTYDFPAAERLLGRLLARRPATPDRWEVQARLGLYRVAFAQGDDGRARGFLDSAVADARLIGDRGGEADAMMGFTSVRGPAAGTLLAALDTLDALLPPGDGRDRAESLCRRGLYTGIGGDTAAIAVIRRGMEMAERVGERRLTGHCLEAYGLIHSVQGHADSVLPIYRRAEVLLRATHDHASLARLESRRSDEFQARGWLGEAKLALSRVRAEATSALSSETARSAACTMVRGSSGVWVAAGAPRARVRMASGIRMRAATSSPRGSLPRPRSRCPRRERGPWPVGWPG